MSDQEVEALSSHRAFPDFVSKQLGLGFSQRDWTMNEWNWFLAGWETSLRYLHKEIAANDGKP